MPTFCIINPTLIINSTSVDDKSRVDDVSTSTIDDKSRTDDVANTAILFITRAFNVASPHFFLFTTKLFYSKLVNVKLVGYDLKSLNVDLERGEHFYCERGAIIYHDEGIDKQIKVFDKGIGGILRRGLSGESIFLVELTNTSASPKRAMVAGKVGLLTVAMREFGGAIICRSGYYVASTENIDIDLSLNLGAWVSGIGIIMQKIRGNGTVFLDSIGTAHRLDLAANDAILVDEKSLICFSADLESRMTSQFSGANVFGGEGLSMLRFAGPGTVFINTVNFRAPKAT